MTQGTKGFLPQRFLGKIVKQVRIHQPTGFEALHPVVQKKNETNRATVQHNCSPIKSVSNLGAQPGWLVFFCVLSHGLGRIEVTPQQWHGQVHEDEIADTAQNFRHDAGVLQLPQLPWPRGWGWGEKYTGETIK